MSPSDNEAVWVVFMRLMADGRVPGPTLAVQAKRMGLSGVEIFPSDYQEDMHHPWGIIN